MSIQPYLSKIKSLLIKFFAVIGLLLTGTILLGAYGMWNLVQSKRVEPNIPDSLVLFLDFSAPIVERPVGFDLSLPSLLREGSETPLPYIVRALHYAKNDPKVKGVIALFGSEDPDFVYTQEIATALESFRQSGKFTYSYAPSYGDFAPGSSLYALASQFDTIWLQPIGAVALSDKKLEIPFAKTALERLGVKADFLRREDYKSVMENVSRDDFSPAVRENMLSILGNYNEQTASLVAKGRKIDAAKARALMQAGPYTAKEALNAGLVNKLGYQDEFTKEVEGLAGKDAVVVEPAEYLTIHNYSHTDETRPTIALIHTDGLISDALPDDPYSLASDETAEAQEIVEALGDAAENKNVKAILLRVNSPGGSPVASESIRHAVVKAKESKKPVYVSMGSVAASGGYWVSMNADRIFANPATLTGSIGVVAGKFVLGDLFEKLGVKWETLSESEQNGMWSLRTPFDDKGRARMNALLDETYQAFVENVSAARGIPMEKMPDVAKGRVFTGEQALKVGLVDELGGLDAALAGLKKELKLQPEDRVYLQPFPAPDTPHTIILKILKNLHFSGAMVIDLLRGLESVRTSLAPWLDTMAPTGQRSTQLPSAFQSLK